jgi:hypothetical protein
VLKTVSPFLHLTLSQTLALRQEPPDHLRPSTTDLVWKHLYHINLVQ